jgi:hypothetical protein
VPTAQWVLLAYRLPREPSTPRITLWRKLRRLGALQLVDGLVTLPADPRTVEAFEWLAEEVEEAGGAAWTWLGRAGSKAQENMLRQQLTSSVAAQYRALLAEAKSVGPDAPRRTVERLRRELNAIEHRDHFSPREREQARRAIERLTSVLDDQEIDVAR